MHDGREVGRIGRAGIPLPTFHYHLDDECYPPRLGERRDVFREWFTWASIVQWLQPMRLMPSNLRTQAVHNWEEVVPISEPDRPAELHGHPPGSSAQQMSP